MAVKHPEPTFDSDLAALIETWREDGTDWYEIKAALEDELAKAKKELDI